jgi:hypothetical protein
MRRLWLIVCLLLAACTSTHGGTPAAGTLTAAGALGDFETLDYCSLLDTAGRDTVPSFEKCQVLGDDEVFWQAGPVTSASGIDAEPYAYPGELPPGVRIHQLVGEDIPGCVLFVGFADRIWLVVSGQDTLDEERPKEELCAPAGDVVAGVIAAIDGKRVKHVSYGPDSFGGIDACALIDRPEIESIAGAGETESRPSGHYCRRGRLSLTLDMGKPVSGRPGTVGGRPVTIRDEGEQCSVSFERPLPDRPGLAERAQLTMTRTFGDCRELLAVGGMVLPELPR